MSALVNAETVTVQAAREVTPGTLAAAGWKEFQVNPGGIGNAKADITTVIPAPLSRRRQREDGIAVDLKSAPSITHDLTKDLIDFFADGIFLASAKQVGNSGLGVFKPTAVTATDYTVAASGALTAGFLIRARNFRVAGNNGVKVVGAASTGTAIKATGLAAETPSGYTPLVEVCGWQGAATDIGLDASGNLTSVAGVFTSWNLTVGQIIFIGDDVGVTGNNFANTVYRGTAKVKAITATLLTLERRAWTVGAADPGTGKTIRVWFGRNWANGHSDAANSLTAEAVQPNYSLEVPLPGAAAAAATSYMYGLGSMVTMFELNAPDRNKVEATVNFVGRDFTAPTTVRATNAATSEEPIATARFNTVDHESLYLRVTNSTDESALLVDIQSWKLMINQNVSPQNQQGTYGAKRMIIGKCVVDFDVTGFMVQDDIPKAVRDRRFGQFGAMLRNADGAVFVDAPQIQASDGAPDFPENGAVTFSTKLEASREKTLYSSTIGFSTFPYAPAA